MIQNYLETEKPSYALMISGDWGAGKTYFWKNTIVPLLERKSRHHVYVSLYGVASNSEIEQQVSYGIFPFLDSKVARLAKFMSELGKLKIPPISYIPKLQNAVFCFDDFERAEFGVNKSLGFINKFIEQYGSHVLILANERQISDLEAYRKTKEKVVGKTLELVPDINEALESIWQKFSAGMHQQLDPYRETIQESLSKASSTNLRSAIHAIDNCKVLMLHLASQEKLTDDSIKRLLQMTCALTIEEKCDPDTLAKLRELIDNPSAMLFAAYSNRKNEDNTQSLAILDSFAAQYFEGNIDDIPPLKSVIGFIETGWIDAKALHHEVSNLNINPNVEIDLNKSFLRNIWSLTDDEIFTASNYYLESIQARSITTVTQIAQAFTTLLLLSKNSVIETKPDTLTNIFLEAVQGLSDNNTFTEADFCGWESHGTFYGSLDAELNKLIICIDEAHKAVIRHSYAVRVKKLFNEFKEDFSSFITRINSDNENDHFDYEHNPVFATWDANALTSALLSKANTDIQTFSQLLNQRYLRVINIGDYLHEEIPTLESLKGNLTHQLNGNSITGLKRLLVARIADQLNSVVDKLSKAPSHNAHNH